MGRKSLAEQIYQEYQEETPGNDTWLVVYDFQGIKPTTKFYDNISRIMNLTEDSQLVQYSVFMTRDQRAAKAVKDLVQHYNGQVSMFKGEMVEL
jgi:hypothetical protein